MKVLEMDRFKCVCCGSIAKCVHHTNYAGKVLSATEPRPSLMPLCFSCHYFVEFGEDGKKILNVVHINKRLRALVSKNSMPDPWIRIDRRSQSRYSKRHKINLARTAKTKNQKGKPPTKILLDFNNLDEILERGKSVKGGIECS